MLLATAVVKGGPIAAADAASLRHVSDETAGLRRVRRGRSFSYVDTRGRPLCDPATLARIRALAIPPAWTEVWSSPDPDGHIQATGRDARGRKQYRYHPKWRLVRDEAKYYRLVAFCRKSYVHPRLLDDFAGDRLAPALGHAIRRRLGPRGGDAAGGEGLARVACFEHFQVDALRAIEPVVARYLDTAARRRRA
jgi:DNA topoisomerase IB